MVAGFHQLWQAPPATRGLRFVKRSIQGPALGPVRDRTQFIMARNDPKTPERFV
jgi:hypothetical protein